MTTTVPAPRLGIALGGGAARGWAHIGVLNALAEDGIRPDIVCGTSAGALVGGIYSAGKLAELEQWVLGLTRRDVFTLLDFVLGRTGAFGGRRLIDLYRQHLGDVTIEELPRSFAAVATDLHTGAEVWLQEGPLLSAIRASISVPGLFTPVRRDGRWLVDGGLVNPVPVNLCRVLGADVVIAVDLNRGPVVRRTRQSGTGAPGEAHPAVVPDQSVRQRRGIFGRAHPVEAGETAAETPPGVAWVVATAIDIMEDRIGRSRLAGDPPDLLLTPHVRHVPPLEFAGGRPTIDEGYNVMKRMLPALHALLDVERSA